MIASPLTLAPDQIFLICAILFTFGFFLVFWTIWKRRQLPYYSADYLLTNGEAVFYSALRKAIPEDFHIIYKVRLGDVVRCSDRMWDRGFGPKIATQHIDFVIVNHHNARIKLCIELDDNSHHRPQIKRRDYWKTRVLKTAGLPLMRIRAKSQYNIDTLRRQFWMNIRSRNESYIRKRRQRLN